MSQTVLTSVGLQEGQQGHRVASQALHCTEAQKKGGQAYWREGTRGWGTIFYFPQNIVQLEEASTGLGLEKKDGLNIFGRAGRGC